MNLQYQKCEHPVILLDRNFIYFAKKYGTIVIRNRSVLRFCDQVFVDPAKFQPKRWSITHDDLITCYFLDIETGETRPLYMEVPCGKCRLCRAKKSRELMARCTAETNRWGRIPLFITFTYSDKFLPKDGLQKRDLQLFFKRLRSRLDYYNIEHNLRYFAVGEYGSKTHRAHYHVILWNFPVDNVHFPSIVSVQHFIEKAWSRFDFETDADGKAHRVAVRDASGRVLRYPSGAVVYSTRPIGWIKILPVTKGCPAYVTKYMRKECFVPKGQNPVFQLSSNRGGGIGSHYILENLHVWRQNPAIEALPVADKLTGSGIHYMPITPYVKSKLDPSPSTFLKKKQYETYRDFLSNISIFQHIASRLRDRDILDLDRYDYRTETCKHWYDPFSDPFTRRDWNEAFKRCQFLKPSLQVEHNLYNTMSKEEVWDYISVIIDRLNLLSQKILADPDYNELFLQREKRLQARSVTLQNKYANTAPVDVSVLVDALERSEQRNSHKEFF